MSLGFSVLVECATHFFPFSPARLLFLAPLNFFSNVIWNVDGIRAEMCFSSTGNCSCLALSDLPAFPDLLGTFGTGISAVPHHSKDLFMFVYLHNKISKDFRAFPVGSCPSVQSNWCLWKYMCNNHSLDSYCISRVW